MKKRHAREILKDAFVVRYTDVTVRPPVQEQFICCEFGKRLARRALRRLKYKVRLPVHGGW